MHSRGFHCNICCSGNIGRTEQRGDGKNVLYCGDCGMGVIENPPESTASFYADGYYGGEQKGEVGYDDYSLTAEHTLLWVYLLLEAAIPGGGTVLDIGCADGFLLDHLSDNYKKLGIEVNQAAIEQAKAKGVQIIGNDIAAAHIAAEFGERIDFITSIATFEHVLDFKRAFTTATSLLKPDGAMLLEVPLISKTEDNSDWMNGSYEHIYYPTTEGMEKLFKEYHDLHTFGFECKIRGFSASYIGLVSRSKATFDKIFIIIEAMRKETPLNISPTERVLNVAYNLIHRFDPTPERILALPELIRLCSSSANLMRLVCNLWYSDNVRGSNAEWLAKQVESWRDAHFKASEAISYYRTQAENWEKAFRAVKRD